TFSGKIKFENCRTVQNREGKEVVLSRNGEIKVFDADTDELRGTYPVPYGASLNVTDGQVVEAGEALAEWASFAVSIIADVEGRVNFVDLEEGRSIEERVDEITFLTRKVVIETKGSNLKPAI